MARTVRSAQSLGAQLEAQVPPLPASVACLHRTAALASESGCAVRPRAASGATAFQDAVPRWPQSRLTPVARPGATMTSLGSPHHAASRSHRSNYVSP